MDTGGLSYPALITVGIDPGPHTGIVVFGPEGVLSHETLDMADGRSQLYTNIYIVVLHALETHIQRRLPITVVCERWTTIAPGVGASAAGELTARLCGWVEGICSLYGITQVWQPSSARKAYETLAKSLKLGLGSGHEVSAASHVLAYHDRLQRMVQS